MEENTAAPNLPSDHAARLARTRLSLDGLSVGDAFGECFFFSTPKLLQTRQVPPAPWSYTDDTAMALSIFGCLAQLGEIECDTLAKFFASEYRNDPNRGYGVMAHEILDAISRGHPWNTTAAAAFGGEGSMGNGGAMRVAPLGAYFADDLEQLVENARRSAIVTHAHPEGAAGAIAVAVAAAWAWNHREAGEQLDSRALLELALKHTPEGETRRGIASALEIPLESTPQSAGTVLGNGSQVIAPDTVPFALWCAARHWRNYPEALWSTISVYGDIDTNCAIVGGIVALSAGAASIPANWLTAREPLPIPPTSKPD